MSIEVNWDNSERSVVRVEFSGIWSWGDFELAAEQYFTLIESVPQRTDVLFDMRESAGLPHGALLYFKRLLQAAPANHGALVLVSSDHHVFDLVAMFYRIHTGYAMRIVLAKSVLEARAQLIRLSPAQTPSAALAENPTLSFRPAM